MAGPAGLLMMVLITMGPNGPAVEEIHEQFMPGQTCQAEADARNKGFVPPALDVNGVPIGYGHFQCLYLFQEDLAQGQAAAAISP